MTDPYLKCFYSFAVLAFLPCGPRIWSINKGGREGRGMDGVLAPGSGTALQFNIDREF